MTPKVFYYRNPMNPEVTSPVPMKDAMGMDYVPVYEEQKGASKQGVYISPEKQQLIGIKTEKIEKRRLVRQILTVGKVAYDPELYVAQQEYLEALKAREALSGSSIKDQAESLVAAAQRKLMLRGMSEAEIKAFAQRSEPQGNLYLPTQENTVWIYAAVYEYEVGLIKEGLPVDLEALAYPSEIFQGKISAVRPVFDPATRATEARIEVDDPAHKLKPQMFVDARINVDLGEKLAVSVEAVVDSGERTLVFIAKPDGYFDPREVRLGHKAGDYYEVLAGLEEGERVVASGNFFVDSESRLKSVISDAQGHQHSPDKF
jgi:Cu(I)/Ag(I) efflux system membrane fusion protein